ncbi:MAG TPA: DUF4156 domain-containing protein [Spirochaetota bacterium]|mgnify:CR=1 FL=1|nr:DUF4156 domain-containing protein [Spirochaetota bacterium]
MSNRYIALGMFMLIALAGCFSAQLKEGAGVDYVTKKEAPAKCKKIGEVELSASNFEVAISASDVIVKLRNKTAIMGGDFLVVDIIEAESNNAGKYYTGFGRAYKCK